MTNKNQVAVLPPEHHLDTFSPSLGVTRNMLVDQENQRKMLKEFVSGQLRSNIDYGVVPGTKKPSLLKPGAEKIRGLFGLNIKLDCTSKELDRTGNFAMFTYKAQVYRGDNLVAECEGSANSQEQKYKERTVWRWSDKAKKKEAIKEDTPVCDILNTLQKMAQKRAYVGAVILAVGASDFFSQDIDDPEDARSVGTAPRIDDDPSAIPNATKVSETPNENQHSVKEINVEALISYDERQVAIEAGFKWNKDLKKWTKKIPSTLAGSFPFEVVEIK